MTVHYPSDQSALEFQNLLDVHHVNYDSKGTGGFSWTSVIASFLPILLLVGFWIFPTKRMQGGGSKVVRFRQVACEADGAGLAEDRVQGCCRCR